MFNYENSIQVSQKFAAYYKPIAEKYGCEFLDAAEIVKATPADALHFDSEGHRKFGEAVADKVKKIFIECK